jgi:DNA-binding NtrC family response regulator
VEILTVDMISGTPPRIFIVDDDPAFLAALSETVRLRLPHAVVETVDSTEAALKRIAGADLIPKFREVRPSTPMMLMSGNPNPQGYAVRAWAYAFIHTSIDREYFIATLRRAVRYSRLSKRIQGTTEHVKQHLNQLAELQRRMAEHAAIVRGHYAGGTSITSVSKRVTPPSSHRV